jgi:hypothetical protein
MTLVLKLAALGGVALALLSAYPGVLVDLMLIGILLSPLWVPALILFGSVALFFRGRSAERAVERVHVRAAKVGGNKIAACPGRALIALSTVLALSLALAMSGIPRRVAFRVSRPAFERLVISAPVSPHGSEVLGRMVGLYYVDRYAADPRGGVYFRTHAGADGIGPDTMSHGFAYRPNPQGTPFGRAGYRCSRVVGDWYVFSASDDY